MRNAPSHVIVDAVETVIARGQQRAHLVVRHARLWHAETCFGVVLDCTRPPRVLVFHIEQVPVEIADRNKDLVDQLLRHISAWRLVRPQFVVRSQLIEHARVEVDAGDKVPFDQ